jgi:hypothetical protein
LSILYLLLPILASSEGIARPCGGGRFHGHIRLNLSQLLLLVRLKHHSILIAQLRGLKALIIHLENAKNILKRNQKTHLLLGRLSFANAGGLLFAFTHMVVLNY